MTSARWRDLDRPPLSQRALAAALVRPGGFVTDLRVVDETGSTNDDVAALARGGAGEGLVLVAEEQTGGRGRLDRRWASPPQAGLTFSVLLRPPVPVQRRTWVPLLVGLAVRTALHRLGEVETRLKWPNDVLLGPDRGKVAGVLVQAEGDALVAGVGLNVTTRRDELPAGATSLAVEAAACTLRDPLLRAILRGIGATYADWCAAGADPDAIGLRAAYAAGCDTLGREVRVLLPGGGELLGTATGLDGSGRLLLGTAEGERAVSAGDVRHVRHPGGGTG